MKSIHTWLAKQTRATLLALTTIAFVALTFSLFRVYANLAAGWHHRAAQAAAMEGDIPLAHRHLTQCLEEWPDDAEINFEMARLLRRDGEFASAGRFLTRAAALGWDSDAIKMEKTLLAAQTGDFRSSENTILRWARLGTDEQYLFLEVLIPQYLLRHDLDLALELLTTWIKKEPRNVRALLWLVEASERLRLPTQALDAAATAAEVAPDRADVRAKCGLLLLEYNRVVEARPHLERAVELDPADRAARIGLARCLHSLGESPAAVRLLDELLVDRPGDPEALGVRGLVALQSNHPEEAVQYLRQVLDQTPFDLEALNNMAAAWAALGQPNDAKIYLDRFESAKRDLAELQETTKAVAKEPRNPNLRYKAGTILLRNGQTEGGIRWLESALAENPGHEPTRKALAQARRSTAMH
jgi:tetratricopeptide (TPR) repeat protein